jgi:hypothetical protein
MGQDGQSTNVNALAGWKFDETQIIPMNHHRFSNNKKNLS